MRFDYLLSTYNGNGNGNKFSDLYLDNINFIYNNNLHLDGGFSLASNQLFLSANNLITDEISFKVFAECVDFPIYSKEDKFSTDEGDDASFYLNNNFTRIGVIV